MQKEGERERHTDGQLDRQERERARERERERERQKADIQTDTERQKDRRWMKTAKQTNSRQKEMDTKGLTDRQTDIYLNE